MKIDPGLVDVLRVGALRLDDVVVHAHDEATSAALNLEASRRRRAFGDLAIGSIPGVREARELYRAIGVDPTRTRPSSEALLRRALRGKPMPAVNSAVDAANLVSVEALLPVGLHDAATVVGEPVVRLGRAGEAYEGIGRDEVRLEGRIALCDDDGPFGNPTGDSARSRVTEATTALLFVVYAPASLTRDRLDEVLDGAEAAFRRAGGGTVEKRSHAP